MTTRCAPAAAQRATACPIVGSAISMWAASTRLRPVSCLQGWSGGRWEAGEQAMRPSRQFCRLHVGCQTPLGCAAPADAWKGRRAVWEG